MKSDDSNEQKRMERGAWYHIVDANNTFMDIMSGPNPLTKEEIRKLAKKNPRLWNRFLGFAQS